MKSNIGSASSSVRCRIFANFDLEIVVAGAAISWNLALKQFLFYSEAKKNEICGQKPKFTHKLPEKPKYCPQIARKAKILPTNFRGKSFCPKISAKENFSGRRTAKFRIFGGENSEEGQSGPLEFFGGIWE